MPSHSSGNAHEWREASDETLADAPDTWATAGGGQEEIFPLALAGLWMQR